MKKIIDDLLFDTRKHYLFFGTSRNTLFWLVLMPILVDGIITPCLPFCRKGSSSVITFKQLQTWRAAKIREEVANGVSTFLGKPEAWLKDPHWFCINGHVSGNFLKSEESPYDLCLGCRQPVVLGPLIGETAFAEEMKKIEQGLYDDNLLIAIASKEGRDYITPEDVSAALAIEPFSEQRRNRIRLDLLEIIGKQTDAYAEDAGLCAFIAWRGTAE